MLRYLVMLRYDFVDKITAAIRMIINYFFYRRPIQVIIIMDVYTFIIHRRHTVKVYIVYAIISPFETFV